MEEFCREQNLRYDPTEPATLRVIFNHLRRQMTFLNSGENTFKHDVFAPLTRLRRDEKVRTRLACTRSSTTVLLPYRLYRAVLDFVGITTVRYCLEIIWCRASTGITDASPCHPTPQCCTKVFVEIRHKEAFLAYWVKYFKDRKMTNPPLLSKPEHLLGRGPCVCNAATHGTNNASTTRS